MSRSTTRIALVLLGAIASGLLSGLLLVLVALDGAAENAITGAALVALGAGFTGLALASARFTDQPQRWALAPGVTSAGVGLAVWLLAPSSHALTLTGWVWPVLLAALVAWSVRGARRDLHGRSRRLLLYPALFVLLLVAAGGAFETVVEETSSTAPLRGRTYLVDGHRLYLDCVGRGAPAVVLFNGLGERTRSWALIQRSLARSTRVCTYDRAGEGGSGGTAGESLTRDLHGLLAAARVPGPYVLAGHSIGGTYAMLYASTYPRDVAGLALIDSSTPYQFDLPNYPSFYSMWHRAGALLPSLERVGLVRLAGNSSSARELSADRVEFEQLPQLFDATKSFTGIGAKPLAVVTALRGAQRGWAAAQARLARLSTNSTHVTVAEASHSSLIEDRRFASIASGAIDRVVREVRP